MAVLLIDDHADSLETIGILFQLAGVASVPCDDPLNAVGLAELVQPDVCVVDVSMPGLDGLEVARRIASSPRIIKKPVMIAYTGRPDCQAEAFDSGYLVYLMKTSTPPDKLVDLVKAHIYRRQRDAVLATIQTDLRGQITQWDEGAEQLYGWRGPEVLGKHILNVTPSNASRSEAADIMMRLSAGESWFGKFQVVKRSGEPMDVFVHDFPVRSKTGELAGILGYSFMLQD
ncbi:MAG TPA: response regulator [Planctomycetota bacterium]|nr:response regulator [Planctomycetota bacterium]